MADTKKGAKQPIIIKRVKKAGHAAHGGAWKIAYADFVTAMMAFFLLMWLLGSTTEGDKKGIADYFQTPLRVALTGGSGSGDSSSVVKGGGEDLSRSTGQVKDGEVKAERKTINLQALKAEIERSEKIRLRELQTRLEGELRNNPKLAPYSSQIRMDMTRDGLRIQIVDDQARPMFDSGSALVKEYMRDVLRAIGSVLGEVPNKLTIEGHTDSTPFAGGERGYSNWELSSERANASRRELLSGGLAEERVMRVQGLASSQPLERDNPLAAANRRISIVVLNREAEQRYATPQLDVPSDAQQADVQLPALPEGAKR
jgi:chemotaxis protein MotB